MNDRCHESLRGTLARGERAVLVAVAAAAGSTPREYGATMVVTATGITGTIGGGHLEYEALRMAREALTTDAPSAQWLVRFPLAARLGQCCGGVATLSFATLDASALGWLDTAGACLRANAPCVVVGRIDACAGDRLVVTRDTAHGTLGEPTLDAIAIAQARGRLVAPLHEPRGTSGVLTVEGTTLFAHLMRPEAFTVYVFGNGHVGRALVQVLGTLPASVRWIDAREDEFPAQVPVNVEIVATDDPAGEVAGAPHGAYLVVMTHSHPLDFEIVEAALARDDWRYLGLIGSKSKRAQFERRSVARGTPPEALRALTCPIGRSLASKEPGVIAVAVAAELIAVREAGETRTRVSSRASRGSAP